jgi:hypothetical protein
MVTPIVIGNRNSCCYKCQFARCPANQRLQARFSVPNHPTEIVDRMALLFEGDRVGCIFKEANTASNPVACFGGERRGVGTSNTWGARSHHRATRSPFGNKRRDPRLSLRSRRRRRENSPPIILRWTIEEARTCVDIPWDVRQFLA